APYSFDSYNAGMFEAYLLVSEYADTGLGYCAQQMGSWVRKTPTVNAAAPVTSVAVQVLVAIPASKPPPAPVAQPVAQQNAAERHPLALVNLRNQELVDWSGSIPAQVARSSALLRRHPPSSIRGVVNDVW
ncbi:hypothetical protein FRB90_007269, partial [Tulasnella sp. 427]